MVSFVYLSANLPEFNDDKRDVREKEETGALSFQPWSVRLGYEGAICIHDASTRFYKDVRGTRLASQVCDTSLSHWRQVVFDCLTFLGVQSLWIGLNPHSDNESALK